MSSHEFKQSTKTIQGQNFNQIRHMDYFRELSMEQEENKHKTSSMRKVKDLRETNKKSTEYLFYTMLMFHEAITCL